jgi:hypothetical protein
LISITALIDFNQGNKQKKALIDFNHTLIALGSFLEGRGVKDLYNNLIAY